MSVELKSFTESNDFGTVAVAENVWAIEPNVDLMQMAVVRQLNNARVGTACTKTRTEVRGGGKKPWKQKGTGRARAGSSRSPVWRGGGITFGPKPRSYKTSMNRKMASKALASALSANREQVVVVADQHLNVAKTREFSALLSKMELSGKKILLLANYSEELYRATRNIPSVSVINPMNLGVKDVLNNEYILVSTSALETLQGRFA